MAVKFVNLCLYSLKYLILSAGLLIFAGCVAKNGNSGPNTTGALHARVAPGHQGSGDPKVTSTADGTSDTGGGNGDSNEVYESKSFDPLASNAFKSFVAPILERIILEDDLVDIPRKKAQEKTKEDNKIDSSKELASSSFANLFKTKTWYLSSSKLNKIDKSYLGVSFLEKDHQQIALQTLNEVWIDKSIFESMTEQQQGELLLHELIMSLYFMKFKTMEEICTLNGVARPTNNSDEGCDKHIQTLNKALLPQAQAPLDETDYQNIRFITSWLINNKTDIMSSDFDSILAAKNFDPRMFKKKVTNDAFLKEIKMSSKAVMDIMKATEIAGNAPSVCEGLNTKEKIKCNFHFSEEIAIYNGLKVQGITKVTLQLKAENKILFETPSWWAQESTFTYVGEVEGGSLYSYIHMRQDPTVKIKIGDIQHSVIMLFKLNASSGTFVFQSAIVKPGVVTGFDLTGDGICKVQSPNPQGLNLDTLYVHGEQHVVATQEERLILLWEPFAACSKENIEE